MVRPLILKPKQPDKIKPTKIRYIFKLVHTYFKFTESDEFRKLSIWEQWECMQVMSRALYEMVKNSKTDLGICSLKYYKLRADKLHNKLGTFEHALRAQHYFEMSLHPYYRDIFWSDYESAKRLINYSTLGCFTSRKENTKLRGSLDTTEGIKTIKETTDMNYIKNKIKMVHKDDGSFYESPFDPTEALPDDIRESLNSYDRLPKKELNLYYKVV